MIDTVSVDARQSYDSLLWDQGAGELGALGSVSGPTLDSATLVEPSGEGPLAYDAADAIGRSGSHGGRRIIR